MHGSGWREKNFCFVVTSHGNCFKLDFAKTSNMHVEASDLSSPPALHRNEVTRGAYAWPLLGCERREQEQQQAVKDKWSNRPDLLSRYWYSPI